MRGGRTLDEFEEKEIELEPALTLSEEQKRNRTLSGRK